MKSRVTMFLVGFAVWCLLNWLPDWQNLVQNLVAGAVVSAIVSAVMGSFLVTRPHLRRNFGRFSYFVTHYIPVFLWELLKANLDVAYRVIHPTLPINPGIVKIRTSLKSDTGLTFLANSITLTPGTMTVDIDRDRGILYIHWINVRHMDIERATQDIAGKFEPILHRVFEEDEV
jgi:multicomponent Na+:H+ antiporter subunit E